MREDSISTQQYPNRQAGTATPAGPLIRASDIAQWIYCQRAWWLALQGHENRNAPALKAGTLAHARHGNSAASSHRTRTAALGLLVLGVLILLLSLLFWLL